MAKLANIARMTTATVGTGTITLGAAVSGYLTFALAGVLTGDVVSYAIEDGANREVGIGTYTAAGTTLTRTTILSSTNGGAAISLTGSAQVFIAANVLDLAPNVAWTAYTPVLGVWTPGNGVGTGFYQKIGRTVHFRANFAFGTTSVAAASVPTLTLPVTALAIELAENISGRFVDAGVNTYGAGAQMLSTTTVGLYLEGTNGLLGTPSTILPFTWGTSDRLIARGTYEAAT